MIWYSKNTVMIDILIIRPRPNHRHPKWFSAPQRLELGLIGASVFVRFSE